MYSFSGTWVCFLKQKKTKKIVIYWLWYTYTIWNLVTPTSVCRCIEYFLSNVFVDIYPNNASLLIHMKYVYEFIRLINSVDRFNCIWYLLPHVTLRNFALIALVTTQSAPTILIIFLVSSATPLYTVWMYWKPWSKKKTTKIWSLHVVTRLFFY